MIIPEYEPISVVEFDGTATENLQLSYNEYKKIISKRYVGILKFFILAKINVKIFLIILLKKYFLKI